MNTGYNDCVILPFAGRVKFTLLSINCHIIFSVLSRARYMNTIWYPTFFPVFLFLA